MLFQREQVRRILEEYVKEKRFFGACLVRVLGVFPLGFIVQSLKPSLRVVRQVDPDNLPET
ncbi:MAG: hypothetical protein Q7R35_04360 [Elusimicrobiota bacterium]|nr:hypothetical protein [Elusimicrobiota bacterium]